MFSLLGFVILAQQFQYILCGNGGLTKDTKIVGYDQNGTPVVWKTHPYRVPHLLYMGDKSTACWGENPSFAEPDFKVENGARLVFQVWFTYDEGGFNGEGSTMSLGRAGATQLDRSHWGRVLHNVLWIGIKPVLQNDAGTSSLDDQMDQEGLGTGSGGTSGSSGTTSISQAVPVRLWPGSRKERHDTAYLSVDASDIARWNTVQICYQVRHDEPNALLMHANMLAWKSK